MGVPCAQGWVGACPARAFVSATWATLGIPVISVTRATPGALPFLAVVQSWLCLHVVVLHASEGSKTSRMT